MQVLQIVLLEQVLQGEMHGSHTPEFVNVSNWLLSPQLFVHISPSLESSRKFSVS